MESSKSKLNEEKHGVDFEEALTIWENAHIDVKNIADSENENRSATLGKIKDKVYIAIWTKRGSSIRLISVRRARKNEEKVYKKNF